jgi:hypothetical protein
MTYGVLLDFETRVWLDDPRGLDDLICWKFTGDWILSFSILSP